MVETDTVSEPVPGQAAPALPPREEEAEDHDMGVVASLLCCRGGGGHEKKKKQEKEKEKEEDKKEKKEGEEQDQQVWLCTYEAASTTGQRHCVRVRPLRERDTEELDRLVELDRQVFGEGSWDRKDFKRYLRRCHGGGFIAEVDGEVAGLVMHIRKKKQPTVAEVANVAVLERFRQMGIASTLLSMALDSLICQGFSSVQLHVAATNVAAQSLYIKHGFMQIGFIENYYWDSEDDRDALLMSRELCYAHDW